MSTFFFYYSATTQNYNYLHPLSPHRALPISGSHSVNPSRSLHVASNPSIRSTSNMGQISTEIISPPGSTLSENQHAQLAASCQLVVNEVHRPHIVRSDRRSTVLPQLRLHPPLGGLVAQLQAQHQIGRA